MLKRDELTNPASCMSRARDDEMTFVLLGRDLAAAATIRFWMQRRIRLGKNQATDPQIQEAAACADKIEASYPPPVPVEIPEHVRLSLEALALLRERCEAIGRDLQRQQDGATDDPLVLCGIMRTRELHYRTMAALAAEENARLENQAHAMQKQIADLHARWAVEFRKHEKFLASHSAFNCPKCGQPMAHSRLRGMFCISCRP